MTDAKIIAEFLRMERTANRKPQGADHEAILIAVSATSGRRIDEVRRLILDSTVMGPV
jgi:hypothetical protein